jgi:hypothetical protein
MEMIFDPVDVTIAIRTIDRRVMYHEPHLNEWVVLDQIRWPGFGGDPRSISW